MLIATVSVPAVLSPLCKLKFSYTSMLDQSQTNTEGLRLTQSGLEHTTSRS